MSDDRSQTAAQLGQALAPLRRGITRAVRSRAGLPDLPDNQVEVLRAVVAEPGLSTGALAVRLQLARPTVSNLLNAMRRAGLVELRRRDDDARAVEVFAASGAVDLLVRFDAVSTEVLVEALDRLSAADRRALERALPALQALGAVFASR